MHSVLFSAGASVAVRILHPKYVKASCGTHGSRDILASTTTRLPPLPVCRAIVINGRICVLPSRSRDIPMEDIKAVSVTTAKETQAQLPSSKREREGERERGREWKREGERESGREGIRLLSCQKEVCAAASCHVSPVVGFSTTFSRA